MQTKLILRIDVLEMIVHLPRLAALTVEFMPLNHHLIAYASQQQSHEFVLRSMQYYHCFHHPAHFQQLYLRLNVQQNLTKYYFCSYQHGISK